MKKPVQLTAEEITALKKKHGKVFKIEIEDAVGFVKKPDRKIMSHALTVSGGGKDGMKFNEIILKDIWLGGDERILNDDDYFFGDCETL